MKSKLFLFLTLILITVSCSTVSKIQTDDVQLSGLIPTNPELVQVYSTKVATKNYKIIGQVVACADAGEDSEIAVKLLKEQASLLGADAIIDLRLAISMGYWTNGIKATGTAVKYN
jgi:Putative heavy-metal-binding